MSRRQTIRMMVLMVLLVGLLPILAAQGAGGLSQTAVTENEDGLYLAFFPIFPGKPFSAGDPVTIQYGINFISSAEAPADALQYQNGLSLNPKWNRFPLYWVGVEQNPGVFNWSAQDVVVQGDVTHGLKTNAILLGTPYFYTTGNPEFKADDPLPRGGIHLSTPETGTPVGLFDPIFTDGTDIPGPGKVINPTNVWARYVNSAVNRYKPGGTLALANGWPAGTGVTHWEMWNEPDLSFFWDGTTADYARLLKVGYLAAKQADPGSKILFGGLANNFTHLSYYDEILTIFSADPMAVQYGYFHDILATHSYSYAVQSWVHVDRARATQLAWGIEKPIWLNETGIPAWNDYPGPVWDPTSALRGRMAEQPSFLIQSAFYAVYAGAEAIFHFQLYDGCGNQPPGTNFPPHNGELCDENGRLITNPAFPCAGDANGLFRNPTDAICFSQHPQPESPRPTVNAYPLLVDLLDNVTPLWWQRDATQEWIGFYNPDTEQRIVGMWARKGSDETAVLTATSSSAQLYFPDGSSQTIVPINGSYSIFLPGATNQNAPWDPTLYMVGGRPVILVEDMP